MIWAQSGFETFVNKFQDHKGPVNSKLSDHCALVYLRWIWMALSPLSLGLNCLTIKRRQKQHL